VLDLPILFLLLQAVISVRTELVAVPVTVTDRRGRHVDGLTQKDFRVFEDGRLQQISVFHNGEEPITIGLIVDRSGSMRAREEALGVVVTTLLQSIGRNDELFAIGFNDDVSFALPDDRPFTHDASEVEFALFAIPAEGRTALYDGVAQGLEHLAHGATGRNVLIVVSDGADNASRETYEQVLALARRSQTVIYAIGGLGQSADPDMEDTGLLKRLCKDTGGVAYFPRSAKQLADASQRVGRDVRAQYTLGFVPEARPDARAFRRIEVKVSAAGRTRIQVRTRSGYVVEP